MKKVIFLTLFVILTISAQAQFSGSTTQYPTTDYSSKLISFELSAVAAALDTDAATLGAALTEYIEAETPATPLFFVQQLDGTESSDPTADANGFWMDAEGTNVGYGDYSVFYAIPDVDADANTFAFNVGQMPGVMEPEQKASATIKLKFNGKEVSFDITLNVVAKPVIPEPATILESKLNVVGSAEIVVEQFSRMGYGSDPISVELGDLVAKLGADPEAIECSMDKIVYATWYNDGDVAQGGGLKKDTLTNVPTGGGVGYWFRPVQNELGETYGEVAAASYGSDDKLFIDQLAYDVETGKLSGIIGQYPGSCKDNEQWYAVFYFIWGNNAYQVRISLNILEREQGSGVEGMTKVGEDVINAGLEADVSNYSYVEIHPDMNTIAAALGIDISNVSMQALDDKNNWAEGIAGNGGFWFDKNGYALGYVGNTACFFVEPTIDNNYSSLIVGQYPRRLGVGNTYRTKLYFVYESNYYELTVNLNVVGDGQINGLYYNFISKAKIAEVISGSVKYSGNIVIPQTVEYEGNVYTVTSIGSSAFSGCTGLISVEIPLSVTSLGNSVFSGCTGLTSVEIPLSVTSLGNSVFYGCTRLTSVEIPSSVMTIGSSAFDGCRNLTSLTIGSNVNSISSQAFANCQELLDVYCYAERVPTTWGNAFDGSYPEYATLHVPEVAYEIYRTTEPWGNFGTIKVIDGETPVVEKCATPTISYINGKVRFACETEGVEFVPTVTCTSKQMLNGNELELGGTYTISVYAVKEGYDNSDTATMTINMSQMGDVNGDGQVTITDVTTLVNVILGK